MVTVNVEGFWKMTEYGHAIFKHSEIHKFMWIATENDGMRQLNERTIIVINDTL